MGKNSIFVYRVLENSFRQFPEFEQEFCLGVFVNVSRDLYLPQYINLSRLFCQNDYTTCETCVCLSVHDHIIISGNYFYTQIQFICYKKFEMVQMKYWKKHLIPSLFIFNSLNLHKIKKGQIRYITCMLVSDGASSNIATMVTQD